MRRHVLPVLAMILLAQSLVACARYRYAIVEPVEHARLVPEEGEMMLDRPPLKYVLADLDERLGLAIINDTNELMRLREGRSYVVDPEGETHPLPGRIIAPNSHVLLRIPPVRERYRGYASSAFGPYGYGPYYGGYRFHYYDPWYHARPYYYETVAPRTIYDWSWGRGQIRVHLAYEVVPAEEAGLRDDAEAEPGAPATAPAGGETFVQEFVLVRAKEDELTEGRAPYLAE